MGQRPKMQDLEAVVLVNALRKKLKCKTDSELARELGVASAQISRWKNGNMPNYFRVLLKKISK